MNNRREVDPDGWVAFDEFGSFYKIMYGSLYYSPQNADGTRDMDTEGVVETCFENANHDFLEKINAQFETDFTYEDIDGKGCINEGKWTTAEKTPAIDYDSDTFDEVALSVLKKRFPKEVVVCQHFNHEFYIDFEDGRYGYCGVVNGWLGCDIYPSISVCDDGEQPSSGVKVAYMRGY